MPPPFCCSITKSLPFSSRFKNKKKIAHVPANPPFIVMLLVGAKRQHGILPPLRVRGAASPSYTVRARWPRAARAPPHPAPATERALTLRSTAGLGVPEKHGVRTRRPARPAPPSVCELPSAPRDLGSSAKPSPSPSTSAFLSGSALRGSQAGGSHTLSECVRDRKRRAGGGPRDRRGDGAGAGRWRQRGGSGAPGR